MSIWDVPLDKLQNSRLLALRMHVARYVVRAGARQRSAVALVDDATRNARAGMLLELLEAVGAQSPEVLALPVSGEAALPLADVLILGESGLGASEVAARWRSRVEGAAAWAWAVDVDRLTGERDARVVQSVEALIRMIMPEALGANGTPPDASIAVRLI